MSFSRFVLFVLCCNFAAFSNLAISLAGEIVQNQSGQEYQYYIKANILDLDLFKRITR